MKLSGNTHGRLKAAGVVSAGIGLVAACGLVLSGIASPAAPPPVSDKVAAYAAAAPIETIAPLPVMAVVGDSFSLDKPEYWQQHTARCINHRPLVSSIGGSGFAQPGKNKQPFDFPARVKAVAASKPDLIVFATAFNDAAYTTWKPDVVRDRIVETLETYRQVAPKAKMVIMGPFWAIDPLPVDIIRNRDILAEVADAQGVTYVDASTWVRAKKDLAENDGQHPTASGHRLIANKLLAELKSHGLFTPNKACGI